MIKTIKNLDFCSLGNGTLFRDKISAGRGEEGVPRASKRLKTALDTTATSYYFLNKIVSTFDICQASRDGMCFFFMGI